MYFLGAIMCKFRASGQTCVSANRIYVQSSVYADFASRLAEKVTAFKIGNGLDETTYVYSTLRNAHVTDALIEHTGRSSTTVLYPKSSDTSTTQSPSVRASSSAATPPILPRPSVSVPSTPQPSSPTSPPPPSSRVRRRSVPSPL